MFGGKVKAISSDLGDWTNLTLVDIISHRSELFSYQSTQKSRAYLTTPIE